MEREGVCSRSDLDDKRLGQNKELCSFLGVEPPMVNYHAGSLMLFAPKRQFFDYPPASGSKTALTWIPPYYLFFVASLSAFLSASCQLPLFLLQRLSRLDCWYCR